MMRQDYPGFKRLVDRIREKRQQRGWSIRHLASEVGVSPTYLSLVEQGEKTPSKDIAQRLARVLEDNTRLYTRWAQVKNPGNLEETLNAAAEYQSLIRNPDTPHDLKVKVVSGEEVGVLAPPTGALARPAARAFAQQLRREEGWELIPIYAEGTLPGAGPSSPQIVDYLRLKKEAIHGEGRLIEPFAYRVSEQGIEHVKDILNEGDYIVVSREKSPPVRGEIYAVRRKERVALTRVIPRENDLLLFPSGIEEEINYEHIDFVSPSAIVGRVVIVVRAWQYTLFRLGK